MTVILSHPACVGGSLIYRYLVSSLDMVGVSEVGVGQLPYGGFQPLDPIYQLFLGGVIDRGELESDFLTRVQSAEAIARRNGKPFLIREHTHGLFFPDEPVPDVVPGDDFSWIAPRLEKAAGNRLPRIFTYRHPVDSWLSLQASFPVHARGGFAQYCANYLALLERVDDVERQGTPLIRVSYETFVASPMAEVRRIGAFLGLPVQFANAGTAGSVFSTGNSGRISVSQVTSAPPRVATRELYEELHSSEHYRSIVECLGYPLLPKQFVVERRSTAARWAHWLRRLVGMGKAFR